MKNLYVKYFDDHLKRIEINPNGDWIDLRSATHIELAKGEYALIPLGIAVQLPPGYEAHIVPRSSTYKNFGIIQANHQAVIDESYRGNDDQWFYPVIALRHTTIAFNDRICQFRIVQKQPPIKIIEVDHLWSKNRGGLGSTGTK